MTEKSVAPFSVLLGSFLDGASSLGVAVVVVHHEAEPVDGVAVTSNMQNHLPDLLSWELAATLAQRLKDSGALTHGRIAEESGLPLGNGGDPD